ncbi:MAG: TolC family protein [Armatimonadetes bacterium]|nr:TolC family protein [Armatimonadota bacterium]
MMRSRILVLGFLLAGAQAYGQDQLTLADALRLAARMNGTVRAAYANLDAVRSQMKVSQSAFLPTLTPNYNWTTSSTKYETGLQRTLGRRNLSEGQLDLTLNYKLLDSGTRQLNYNSSRNDFEASEFNALQTLRNTLFTVHVQYYETLRAQQILRVNTEQEKRSAQILDFTKKCEEVGAGPRKDILQAEADFLNDKVNRISAEIDVENAEATLKATIGFDAADDLPKLSADGELESSRGNLDLRSALKAGLTARADLRAQRKTIKSLENDIRIAKIDAGLTWSIDATVRNSFAPDNFNRSALSLNATMPLYDGHRSKEIVNIRRANLEAQLANLTQNEREIKADIEAAYKRHVQIRRVLEASKLAFEAAKQNFDVAVVGQEKGKFNLLEIQSAQVSLTTAEVNSVQALYGKSRI